MKRTSRIMEANASGLGPRTSGLILALALIIAILAPVAAHAQGCTMCYTAAAQQSAQGKHALDVGILMLLTPAIVLFCGVFMLVWRSKEAGAEEPEPETNWERAGDNEEAF